MPNGRRGDDGSARPADDGWEKAIPLPRAADAAAASVPFPRRAGTTPRAPFTLDAAAPARVCNWLLGGTDNFAVDREAGGRLLRVMPEARLAARANRAFLGQAVRRLAEAGVRQFVDVGCGLPVADNTHQVAQRVAPESRVVYIDIDPMVVAGVRARLADDPRTVVVRRTMCDPWRIVTDPVIREHLDFSRPIGLLLVAVLHYLRRAGAVYEVVRILRRMLPDGSFLVISHLLDDGRPETEQARVVYGEAVTPVAARTVEQVAELFDGLEPVAPGVAHIREWLDGDERAGFGSGRDRAGLARVPLVCGIGRVPCRPPGDSRGGSY